MRPKPSANAYPDPTHGGGAGGVRVAGSPVYAEAHGAGGAAGSAAGTAGVATVAAAAAPGGRATPVRRLSSMDRYFSASADVSEEILNHDYDDYSPEHESDLKFDDSDLFLMPENYTDTSATLDAR